MAEIDKVPLLLEDEKEILDEEEFEEDETFYDRHPEGIEKVSSVQSEMLDLSESGKRRRRYYIHNTELIVAVFVVAFDTKKGNIIEWSYPEDIQLDGIEFRAMASGFHTVNSDFIYFKHNQLFGLSCYEKLSVDSEEERGARMKSIGLLAASYSSLHKHMEFLQEQAKLRVQSPDESYDNLVNYFWKIQEPFQTFTSGSSLATADLPHMEITHPAGCFSQFLQFFGPSIFILWKLALLKKRILIFSPPPIGVICYRVYCACLLASHNLDNLDLDTEINPMFFVNVADIDTLTNEETFIACTTERIFENKRHLYDVYVNNQNIETTSLVLDSFLRFTPADYQRYNKLIGSQNLAFTLSRSLAAKTDDDIIYARFFQQLNTELYQRLMEVSLSEDHILSMEMIDLLGLDSNRDRKFLIELAITHRLNVTVQRQSDMFTCCI